LGHFRRKKLVRGGKDDFKAENREEKIIVQGHREKIGPSCKTGMWGGENRRWREKTFKSKEGPLLSAGGKKNLGWIRTIGQLIPIGGELGRKRTSPALGFRGKGRPSWEARTRGLVIIKKWEGG